MCLHKMELSAVEINLRGNNATGHKIIIKRLQIVLQHTEFI